ncbi:MAG: YncE family protein [Xanthomonadales bacterium]|nr:YncE family protein [Xanthomonadales bacterium]
MIRLACTLLLVVVLPVSADTLLVGNKARDTLSLVDLESGEVVKTLPTGQGPHEVDVSPDGRTAVVVNYGSGGNAGNTMTVVDVPSGEVTTTIDLGQHVAPHGVVWMQDNAHVIVTTEDSGDIIKVHVASGAVVGAWKTGQQVSHMVALSPDDRTAFVSSIRSGTVTRIALEPGAKAHSVATGEGAEGIAVTADGAEVWVANRGDDTITVHDTGSLEVLAELETGDFPIRLEMSADGKYALVTNAESSELGVYQVSTRKELVRRKLQLEGGKGASIFGEFGQSSVPVGIQTHPTRPVIYIAHANGDAVSEISTETWEILRVLDAGPEPDGMAYSPLDIEGS